MKTPPAMHESFLEYHAAFEHRLAIWENEILFTWEWWFGVALTVFPWLFWLLFRKKDSTDRILYAGLFVSLISLALDGIGVQMGAWNYLKPVTPVIPSYVPFDFALMPVVIMVLIQLFPNRSPWLIGLMFGLFTAFIGEPFFKWLKIYDPTNWKNWYSFPIYTTIYVIAFKLTKRKQFKDLS